MAKTCTLEIRGPDGWRVVGQLAVADAAKGIEGPAHFDYAFDYLDAMGDALGACDGRAVSCRYPVAYVTPREERWPAFLLDILPSGAARRVWEQRLGLRNGPESDWQLLVRGAGHAPGNLRVKEAVDAETRPWPHGGFSRQDILERAEAFIEYANATGAPVAGSSGAGGDSPKFLLREDTQGLWHAEGALSDEQTARCWLVKFPRTRDGVDRRILEVEAAYHRVAKAFGARTFGDVTWAEDCLFVPRFDRLREGNKVTYLGMESLCSLAGVSEYGVPVAKETLAQAVALYTTDPTQELKEFLLRDVLDVALGNTDNHARNTAVLKMPDGRIELSPLYDLAPMVLDPRGIARVCRWKDKGVVPRWEEVSESVESMAALSVRDVRSFLRDLGPRVEELGAIMRACGVPKDILTKRESAIDQVARSLLALKG